MMKHRTWSLLVAASLALGAAAAHEAAGAPLAAAPALKRVAAVKVSRKTLGQDISFSAEIRPYQEADLHAKVAGYLKTINVDIGDQVKSGQTLATLDIDELRDDLARADAAYHNAKLGYDRVHQVIERRPELLAQEEVDKAQAAYEVAKADRQRAATMLGYATISAPFEGIVTKRYVDPGTLIQAGTNSNSQALPVVHIAENKRLRVIFPVPESVVPQIHIGTPVEITVSATGQKLASKVIRTAGKIDSTTRTMDAEVDIENTDRKISPGMYAFVKVLLDQRESALALPIQAVTLGKKPTVWRISPENKLEEVPIAVGFQTDSQIEILSGVHEGDEVLFGSRNVASLGDAVEPKLVAAQ